MSGHQTRSCSRSALIGPEASSTEANVQPPDDCQPHPAAASERPSSTDARVKRQAIEWLIALECAECVDLLWPEFHAWLSARPEHRQMYLRIERTWREVGALAAHRAQTTEGHGALAGTAALRAGWLEVIRVLRPRQPARWTAALVISLAVFAVIGLCLPPPMQAEFESEYDKQKTIVLTDNSVVMLNTNSRVRVSLGWTSRDLILERGEGLFKVQRERIRPFQVHVNDMIVRARGTEFSVRRQRDGKIVTAVAEGRVEITPDSSSGAGDSRLSQGELRVPAGDTVTIDALGRTQVDHPGVAGIRRQLSWSEGLISLDRGELEEWVAEFNRLNPERLEIVDPSIAHIQISGTFKASDPENFAQALQDTYGIQHTVTTSGQSGLAVIQLAPGK